MVYHHQYGLPTCAMRFSTVIEPSEFLNEGACHQFFFTARIQTYSDAKSYQMSNMPGDDESDPDVRAMIETLVAGWNGEEKLLLSLNPNGVPYRQHFAMCAISPMAWRWR